MAESFITDRVVKRIIEEEGIPRPHQKLNKSGSTYGAYYANDKEKAEGIVTYGHGQTISKSEYDANRKYYDSISDEEAFNTLKKSLPKYESELKNHLKKVGIDPASLDDNKREVLMDLSYNMGVPRLSNFKRFWAAAKEDDWEEAAAELERGTKPSEKSTYFQVNNKRAKKNIEKLTARDAQQIRGSDVGPPAASKSEPRQIPGSDYGPPEELKPETTLLNRISEEPEQMAAPEEKKKRSDFGRAWDSAKESLAGVADDFKRGWKSVEDEAEKKRQADARSVTAMTGGEKPKSLLAEVTEDGPKSAREARDTAAAESKGMLKDAVANAYNTLTEPKNPDVPLGYGVGMYQTGKRKLPKAETSEEAAPRIMASQPPAQEQPVDVPLAQRLTDVEKAIDTTTKVLAAQPPKAKAAEPDYTGQFHSDVKALRDIYTAQMRTLRDQEDQEQAKIDKREAVQALIQAVGQLSSAYYGLKKGVDMSGVKFQSKDFDKVRDRIMEKFKTEKALAGREMESGVTAAAQARQFNIEDERLQTSRDLAAAKTAAKASGDAAKLEAAAKKAGEKVLSDIRTIYARSGLNEDEKAALAQSAMVQYGVPPAEAKSLVTDEGIIWDSSKDMETALEAITARLVGTTPTAPAATPTANQAEQIINRLLADNPGKLDRAQAEALVRQNRPDLF
jgi:GH24 family phage-related lysozyme (muramidase)